AESKDKQYISELYYISGPELYSYSFAGKKSQVVTLIAELSEKPETIFSKDFFWVYEEDNIIKGAISIFPGIKKPRYQMNIRKYSMELLKITGLLKSLKITMRKELGKWMPKINHDELYIQSLAVFPDYRRQKIGAALIEHAFNYAKDNNINKVSLIVEKQKEESIKMFKSMGFKISDSLELESKYNRYNLFGFYKMLIEI
ncbi:GNAT family N-acetyltransferase, partial [Spirochaetota bacterium]